MKEQGLDRTNGARVSVYALIAIVILAVSVVTLAVVAKVDDLGGDAGVGLVAAFVTGGVSVIVTFLGHLNQLRAADEREASRYEENVLRALDYFTHGSQRRNVGISVVEGAWSRAPQLRPVLVPLLVNQALYLLDESRQTHSRHESQNLDRIMVLVCAAAADSDFQASTFGPLVNSLQRRSAAMPTNRTKGVDASADDVEGWLHALSAAGGP